MMMKKNMADMQQHAAKMSSLKEHLAGAAGRPVPGRPSRPGVKFLGTFPSSFPTKYDPSASAPIYDGPELQMTPRNPAGTQFNQSPPQQQTGTYGNTPPGSNLFGMKKGGKVKSKKMMDGGMAYSKGGSASSRADGIARKGKTKGKMV